MPDKKRLLHLFEQLVSFDSPSFDERDICDFIKKQLSDTGLLVDEDNSAAITGGTCGNLYAFADGSLSLPPLLFCAHMDTVEPSRGKRIETDKNGIITSGGTTVLGADDCAGIAEILEAWTSVCESQAPHRPLEFLFTYAEEPYCKGIRHFDFSKLKSKEAYVLDLTGSVGGAAYQAPAIISFKAVFSGRAAHAGFDPENGINAVKAAAEAISHTECGRTNGMTVNIGTVSGGTADNIVPDKCLLTGEIRSYTDAEAKEKLESIFAVFKNAAEKYLASVETESTVHFPAYCTDISAQVVQRFKSACSELNIPVSLCSTFGGSDNNHLAAHGISGIVAAPGMNKCHSCDEFTTEDELMRAADIVYALMTSTD